MCSFAHSDISGDNPDQASGAHDHSAMTDHHTMHDQTTTKAWELYGALYMSLQYNDPGSAKSHDGASPASNLWLTSDGTTLGFRGSIPLNDGLRAVWQVESEINIDEFGDCSSGDHQHGDEPSSCNDSELAGGHNSFIGLAGDWGAFLAGKHNTPFFDSTIQFDLFHHMPGDVRAILGRIPGVESGTGGHHGGVFNVSASDVLMYKSPTMSGFSFEGAIFGLNETREKVDDKPFAFGVNVRYTQDMFTLVGAYEQHSNFDTSEDVAGETFDTTSGIVLGGMVHFNGGDTMVGAFFEQLKTDDKTLISESRNGYYVNFQQRLLWDSTFRAAYGLADTFSENDGAQMIALSLAHDLGRSAEAYVSYVTTLNDDEADYSNGSVGPIGHGGDPATLATGLVFKF
jgi:predicted porin